MDLTGETHFITVKIGGKTYSGLLREVNEEAADGTAISEERNLVYDNSKWGDGSRWS